MIELETGIELYDLREALRRLGYELVRVEWDEGELVAIVERIE